MTRVERKNADRRLTEAMRDPLNLQAAAVLNIASAAPVLPPAHRRDTHCPNCDGNGWHESEAGGEIPCWFCHHPPTCPGCKEEREQAQAVKPEPVRGKVP